MMTIHSFIYAINYSLHFNKNQNTSFIIFKTLISDLKLTH